MYVCSTHPLTPPEHYYPSVCIRAAIEARKTIATAEWVEEEQKQKFSDSSLTNTP